MSRNDYLYRIWEQGQAHLAAGRYLAARHDLETAEAIAWRTRDARSLARIYLPLLEVRRLIRYQAAEGLLVISPPHAAHHTEHKLVDDFLRQCDAAGTILIAGPAGTPRHRGRAAHDVGSVRFAAQRSGRRMESLLLIEHGNIVVLATHADASFAAGLPVKWTRQPNAIGDSRDANLVVPLPPPGQYKAGELHAMARESLIIAWEALALKWQRRHPPPPARIARRDAADASWHEMAWLRLGLRVDPACEPIAMHFMALAEAVEKM